MRGQDEKQRARLIGELYLPLPHQNVSPDEVQSGPWSDAEMAASFRALKTEIGGTAR